MRTVRRLILCSVLAVLGAVGTVTTPATAAPAQMVKDIWEPTNPASPSAGPTDCMTRDIYLAAGNYLWEGHQRLLDRSTSGDYYHTFRIQENVYLREGWYRWSTCLGVTYPGCTGPGGGGCAYWQHSNSLTERSTGGVARMHGKVPDDLGYEYITRYGANLWRCATEPVC